MRSSSPEWRAVRLILPEEAAHANVDRISVGTRITIEALEKLAELVDLDLMCQPS